FRSGDAQRDCLLALVEDDLALRRDDFAWDHLHAPTASHAPPRAVAAPRRRARKLPDEARPALPSAMPRRMPAAWRRTVEAAKPRPKVSAPAAPSSEPCAWPWKKAKKPTMAAAAAAGTRSETIGIRPRTMTEARITGSTIGSGSAINEAAKPAPMQATKAAGTVRIARPPSMEAHRPTATMASTWSVPKNGCEKPAAKEPCSTGSKWARAGAEVAATAPMVSAMRFMAYSSGFNLR